MKKKTAIDINHLANLANLSLSKTEKKELTKQLSQTVDYIAVLDELKADNQEATSQVTGTKNVSRQDKPKIYFSQKEALSNAPQSKNGYFVTKKVTWE